MLIFPQALPYFTVSTHFFCTKEENKEREKEGQEEREVFGFSATGGLGGVSSSRRMDNAVDIVKFQVFFKQSIYCVTLNPGVTLGPLCLRQGVSESILL